MLNTHLRIFSERLFRMLTILATTTQTIEQQQCEHNQQ